MRSHKVDGWHFRRQHPIDEFIVDFCCLRAGLIIELDGDCHAEPEAIAYDRRREARLRKLGWKVVRFRNEEILAEEGLVLAMKRIREHLR